MYIYQTDKIRNMTKNDGEPNKTCVGPEYNCNIMN